MEAWAPLPMLEIFDKISVIKGLHMMKVYLASSMKSLKSSICVKFKSNPSKTSPKP